MPRVTHVKKARQRYAMVPVIDPETGQPKRSVVTKNGEPRTDKRGNVVTMAVTVQDRTRPLPNLRCDFPGCDIDGGEIRVGEPYQFITVRPGGRGSVQKSRHAAHRGWHYWEYSSSVRAEAARLQHDMGGEIDGFEFTAEEDFESLKASLVEQAQAFADERESAVDAMPEHLQDESEAAQYRDAAAEWVEAIEAVDGPTAEFPAECEACGGTGDVGDVECQDCDGGHTEDPSEDWIDEARTNLSEAVDALEI
jgi:hypothetical protein